MFQAPNKSLLKIGRSSYHSRILELHRSNHFADHVVETWICPEAWLPPEAIDKPLEYPPSRDIWAIGVIFLQMLRGFSVTDQFHDLDSAIQDGDPIPSPIVGLLSSMFSPNRKKSPSCTELTRRLSQITGPMIASATIPIPGMNLSKRDASTDVWFQTSEHLCPEPTFAILRSRAFLHRPGPSKLFFPRRRHDIRRIGKNWSF